MPERRDASRGGEAAQMMLLSGVLLIFAFLALSATVARVAQLGSVTVQEQGRPVLIEIDVVQATVEDLIVSLRDPDLALVNTVPDPDVYSAGHGPALDARLEHLRHLQASLGFDLTWTDVAATTPATSPPSPSLWADSVCNGSGARQLVVALDDGEVRVQVALSETYRCP